MMLHSRSRMLTRLTLAALGALSISTAAFAGSTDSLAGSCPDNYQVKAGLNFNFPGGSESQPSGGEKRAFIVVPPRHETNKPLPVFVSLVGSVEATQGQLYVPWHGDTAKLAEAGFLVIGPIRACAKQDPGLRAGDCNGPGVGGWNWRPWAEGRAAGATGNQWKGKEGPDSKFLVDVVRCAAKTYPIDPRRIYVGGVSSGGTMTNRALLFRSDFWAGGMSISGEWYITKDDGTPLTFQEGRAAVKANPTKIFQGRVGPYPLKTKLDPMIVISVWGGDKDIWHCDGVLCADYRPTTQAASNYFSSFPNVIEVACSTTDGHRWPIINTDAFNLWALKTLASHPKGSPVSDFHLTPPPSGYSCKLGRFTDHYDS